ncbi:MAG: SseB family protein [Sandaracinaceae bacterium]|nr:SseB family protein [Sandaracinaceae bacterium]
MSTTNASQALAAFVRLLLHARAGGQAKVDALLALSQRTLFVPRKLDGSEGFATLINENGDWALPVFTSLEQIEAAADVFGWRRQDHTVAYDEVGARRAVHYALNEGAAFMVIDAIAAHALEATRDELKPLVSTQNRSDTFGPYAGVGRISSSILEATRPTERPSSSSPPIAPPRISRAGAEASFPPPKLPARVTRASFAPPRDDGAPAQRRPTVSFARSSRPPAEVEVHLEKNAWAPDASLELDRSSAVPPRGGTIKPMALPSLEDLDDLTLASDPPDPELRRDTGRPPAMAMAPAPDVLGAPPMPTGFGTAAASHLRAPIGLDEDDELGLGELRPSTVHATVPPTPDQQAADEDPADAQVHLAPLTEPVSDELLAELTELLRAFPEVEWASYSLASQGAQAARPAVGLRVLDSFRANVDDITRRLESAGRGYGLAVWVLLLDDADLIRDARTVGEVFYPWRRKSRV